MASERPPDAFLSYTRFDDQHDGGAISALCRRLASAVQAVTGAPFDIFQDVEGIGIGEHWPGKLDRMLDHARFFIPILTPSYFTSRPCRDELSKFLRAEADRGRNDLVLPIYYIECDVLEEEDLRAADPLTSTIHERQRQDWRDLRYETFRSRGVRRALECLAREIVKARKREMPVTIEWSEEPQPQSFEEAVELLKLRGEPLLHGWLYQAARLVRFEPGRIELILGPGTPPGLPGRVAEALGCWTRRPWLVVLAADSDGAAPTLAEQQAGKIRELFSRPINRETLEAYTRWKYPGLEVNWGVQSQLLRDLDKDRYKNIGDLNRVVAGASDAVQRYSEDQPELFVAGTDFLTKSLGFTDEHFRRKHSFGQQTRQAFSKYGHLVRRKR
jgi:hypothetical protein